MGEKPKQAEQALGLTGQAWERPVAEELVLVSKLAVLLAWLAE